MITILILIKLNNNSNLKAKKSKIFIILLMTQKIKLLNCPLKILLDSKSKNLKFHKMKLFKI